MGSFLSSDSTITITSGATVEVKTMIWKITQLPVILMADPLINSQSIDFDTGSKIGLSSKWSLSLKRNEKSDGKWIGIYYQLQERPVVPCSELYTQLSVAIIDKKKRTIANRSVTLDIKDVFTLRQNEGWGQARLLKEDDTLPTFLVDGDLSILVTFKLYCPMPIVNPASALLTLGKRNHDEEDDDDTDEDLQFGKKSKISN